MTLSSRVCGFFLGGLAAVLGTVVVALFVLVSRELDQRVREQLQTGVSTLIASAEIEPHELEWDRAERQIALGSESEPHEVRWIIRDGAGELIDRSANSSPDVEQLLARQSTVELTDRPVSAREGSWLLRHQRVRAARPESPPPDDPLDDGGYPELTFSAAISLAPAHADARWIATAAAAVALFVWLISALAARWFCRRALAPILSMAADAERIAGHAPDELMRVPASGDELQALGAAFNVVLNECRVAFERQVAFAAAAAHQLRTPLTVILGELEVALRRRRTADELQLVLEATHAGAVDLRRTVESLLLLTRLRDSDRVPLTDIELGGWITQCVAMLHMRNSPDRVQLHGCDATRIRVRGNDVLLRQLLDNLVENALAYADDESRVVIELDADREHARVSVIDSGPGISPDDLPRVFDPFYRSPSARAGHPGGSGLGLAIAARIAGVHGGTLTATSEHGAGSRFTLQLPRCDGSTAHL